MISAQTIEAFWNAVEHVKPLSVGLNCSLGPDLMYPFLAELSEKSSAAISCYPNAGLPNPLSPTGFDLEPPDMAPLPRRVRARRADQHRRRLLRQHARAHRRDRQGARRPAPARARRRRAPQRQRPRHGVADAAETPRPLRLSGSQPFTQQPGVYMMIGERTNVAGSPKFAKLIKEGKYEEAVSVARQQVENGANVIDICMDEGHDRRRRGDDALPAAARQRARGRQGAVHGRLLEVGGHRGGPQVPAGQGHRQLDLAEGRRGEVPRARAHGPASTARRWW